MIDNTFMFVQDQAEHGVTSKLYLRQARAESFRTYTLVAENNVGVTTQNVQLRRCKYTDVVKDFIWLNEVLTK